MRIGLVLPTLGKNAGRESVEAGAEAALKHGWASIWVTDHVLIGEGEEASEYGWILEALISLTWTAARYERLRIGTSVIVPAMRDAPQLAKELATLDVLSGGRLTVGVGVGDRNDLPEWTNLGKAERMSVRGAYLDETIDLWRHLWAGRREPFRGRFHQLDSFIFAPLPAQGASLPIWCGGRSPRAVNRAATRCDGYHASQTGPDDLRARLPDLSEALRAAGRPRIPVSIRARVEPGARRAGRYALSGTPEQMAADLAAFEELGVEDLIVVFHAVSAAEIARETQRFETEVVQRWRAARRAEEDLLRTQYEM